MNNLPNRNPDTGIRYGIISANSLHHYVLDDLCYGTQARDVRYEDACSELEDAICHAVSDFLSSNQTRQLIDEALEMFEYECEEPIYEGVYEGVRYSTTWIGGAMHVWVFESPVTGHYAEGSICVPGAGNLDCPDLEGVVCYDVPDDWRDSDET